MKHQWDRFLIEGNALYDILTTKFDSLFDGNIIKHLTIIDGVYRRIKNTDEMTNEISDDIEKILYPWIKNELKEGRLFDKILWRPFRDNNVLTSMYYGYRKLFKYKEYIFQLAMETYCELDECLYCNPTGIDRSFCSENSEHFSLALYGWTDDNSNILKPYNQVVIPEDSIMPEIHWKNNIYY
jgi:hypothetical protein